MQSAKQKVLIADGLAKAGKERLASLESLDLVDQTGASREDLKKALKEIDVLIVRSRTKVDGELLEFSPNLKLVVRAGIGLDNIDIPAATERGVAVMNAPTGNTVTTAEHAIALMFAASRYIATADASLRAGKWEKKAFQGNQLGGKTLAIVGLGNIGKTVAQRALGLGMRVIGHDPYVSEEIAAKHQIRLLPLDELFAAADYITLHIPLTEGTRYLINEAAFKKMKQKPYIINCSRGGVVDEKALEEALEKEQIRGCALDVFETEPPPSDHPLFRFNNVVVTPHLGASTDEAQMLVGLEVAEQVIQYIRDGVFINAVNVPNMNLEQLQVMKPYLSLCEKLGSFAAQVAPGSVRKIKVHYEGVISEDYHEALGLSALKGYLTPLLSTAVNFVNAKKFLTERGIGVEESFEEVCANFSSRITLTIEGDSTFSCSGSIFGKEEPRIVNIDQMTIEALPEGCLLFTRNRDKPGVIGSMGSILGTESINISRMALGLDKKSEEAIALINVDSNVSNTTLEKLRKSEGMLSVQMVQL